MSLWYEIQLEDLCLQNTNDINLLNFIYGQGIEVKNSAELSNLCKRHLRWFLLSPQKDGGAEAEKDELILLNSLWYQLSRLKFVPLCLTPKTYALKYCRIS